MDIIKYFKSSKPVIGKAIVNHGFDLYEDLYLMKPLIVEDNLNNQEILGNQHSFYPISTTINDKDNRFVIEILEISNEDFIGYKLNRIKLPKEIFSTFSKLFTNQPFLQWIMDELVVDFLNYNTIKELPDTYKILFPDLEINIKIKSICYEQILQDKFSKIQLTYCELYSIDKNIYKTLSMPVDIEQVIVNNFKKINFHHIEKSFDAERKKEVATCSSILYGGESYDLADITAINLNRISEAYWDIPRDLASKLKVQNPAATEGGVIFNVINTLYNPLINLMRSRTFIYSRVIPNGIPELTLDLSGPLFKLTTTTLTFNMFSKSLPNMNPVNNNFRSYNKQMNILEEYIACNLPVNAKDPLLTNISGEEYGINQLNNSGIDGMTHSGYELFFPKEGLTSTNTAYKDQNVEYNINKENIRINSEVRRLLEKNIVGDIHERNEILEKSKLIPKINRTFTSEHLENVINHKPLDINIKKNDFYLDTVHVNSSDINDDTKFNIDNLVKRSSNINMDNLGIKTRTIRPSVNTMDDNITSLGAKISNLNIVEIEVNIRKIDEIVRSKFKTTNVPTVFEIDSKIVNLDVSDNLIANQKQEILKENLNVLSSIYNKGTISQLKKNEPKIWQKRNSLIKGFNQNGQLKLEVKENKTDYKNIALTPEVDAFKYNNNLQTSIASNLYSNSGNNQLMYNANNDPLYFIRQNYKVNLGSNIYMTDSYQKFYYETILKKLPLFISPLFSNIYNNDILFPVGDVYYKIPNVELNKDITPTEINPYAIKSTGNNNVFKRRGDWIG